MSRRLQSSQIVAFLSGLAGCSLLFAGLTGCESKPTAAGKGKFQVASAGDGEQAPEPRDAVPGEPTEGDDEAPQPLFKPKNGAGQASAKPPVVPSEKLGDYRVPMGEPEEIHAFMKSLNDRRPRGGTQDEARADFIKIQRARAAAADKLLSLKGVEKEVRFEAVSTKINALETLLQRGDESALDELMQFLVSLGKDTDPEIARSGRLMTYDLEMMMLAQEVESKDADPQPIVARLKKLLATEEKNADSFRVVQRTASILDQLGKREQAIEAFRLIGEAFITSEEAEVAEAGQAMLDQALLTEVEFDVKLEAAATDKEDSIEPLLEALKKVLAAEKLGANSFDHTSRAASIMEFTGHYELSGKILEQVGKAFKDNPSEKIAKAAEEAVANGGKRLGLLGKPFAVEGELLDGTPLDWSKYKGKVVLLDFWATWCAPCIKELPNIKRNYEKYKDQGFEVVGVNCDDDKMAVERFFAGQELPWANIHSTDPDALGLKNPLAAKCGVDALPFLVLINAQGKVEAIHVHGEKLNEKLAGIFDGETPSKEKPTTEKPAAETGRKGPPPKKSVDGKTGSVAPVPAASEWEGPTYFIAVADKEAEEEAKTEEESNPYLADAGLKTEELVDFILKMDDKPKSIQKRPGFGEAVVDAADRILAAKPADKFQYIAIESKLGSLHKRACLGNDDCDKALIAFVESLKEDARERVAREVKFFQLERQVIEGDQLPVEKLPDLLATLKEFYAKEKLTDRHLRIASSTVALINRLEDGDGREKEFKEVGGLLAKSSDKQLARYGKKLAKTPGESESKLVGQPLEVVGNTSDGVPFKWDAYRGKVVLVDFWATWCGPCRREMPNVKALYEKHKDKGFEVVGVSLDKDLDALADYLAENEIPWTTLSGDETQDLADKYSVRGIPTMMLVDKDGKIVGVSHGVAALTSKLEKLLAPPAVEKPAQ